MTVLVAGDDAVFAVTLKKDNAVFSIDSSAVVKAAVISQDRTRVLCGPVVCSNTSLGANWPSSLVMVLFPSNLTSTITQDKAGILEIEVNDGGKLTWFSDLRITKGMI